MTKASPSVSMLSGELRTATSPRQNLAELQDAFRRARQELEADRQPWEIPKRWRDAIPSYEILRESGIRDRLIKALFYGPHRAAVQQHWCRKFTGSRPKRSRNIKKLPLIDDQDWIALYAVLNGFDQGETAQPQPDWRAMPETQALLKAWRSLHNVASGWPDTQVLYSYMQPIAAALTASVEARSGFRAKLKQSNEEVLRKFEASTRIRIVRWLLANSPSRARDIAAALGLREDAVRQQLARLIKDRAWLDFHQMEMAREGRGLYRLQRIEKAAPPELVEAGIAAAKAQD